MRTRDTRKFHVTEVKPFRDGDDASTPAFGGPSHAVWLLCDLLTISTHAADIPSLERVQTFAKHLDLKPTNVRLEYGSWRRYNGFGTELKPRARRHNISST